MFNQYPIGVLTIQQPITNEQIKNWIVEIDEAPAQLKRAVEGLTKAQLATPYREGGWTLQQVVHHMADSHLNAYTRIKLGLTENNPTIRPYDEKAWALLSDSGLSIEVSIGLLSSLHKRLVTLLQSLAEGELKRTIQHPDNGTMTIAEVIGTYAWHGKHHIAHITTLRKHKNW
ncbi:YfiT family bacillithiol transferase [Priestia flexa]|uniref:YfiT family bacillithiol transferase n=1 Tax=Priestia flexa TaxID=86664 RepID=UPI001B330819|nr:bacillithiol transferase BstA [Priestia flexa]